MNHNTQERIKLRRNERSEVYEKYFGDKARSLDALKNYDVDPDLLKNPNKEEKDPNF